MSAPAADPATPVLLSLRAGTGADCVFLFPGGGGEARELQVMADALDDGRPMVGVQPVMASPVPRSVEAMAAVALAAMQTRQPHGPYRLVGYSFGGLVAMEVARLCRERGEPVALLALVDTVFDQRYWPTAIFLDAQLHRLAANLRTMATSSPGAAAAQFGTRARGLWRLLAQRLPGAPPRSRLGGGATPSRIICDAAMSAYRPSPYPGPVSLFQSVVGRDFGCEPAALWRPLAGRLEVHAIPGRHLDLVRVPAIRAILAVALDAALAGADAVPEITKAVPERSKPP